MQDAEKEASELKIKLIDAAKGDMSSEDFIKALLNGSNNKSEKNFDLKKQKMPTFGGEIKMWRCYRSSLELLMEEKSINEIRKILAGKESLYGEAFELVKNTGETKTNLQVIFEKLIDRYDNDRNLVNNEVDQVLNIKFINDDLTRAKLLHDLPNNVFENLKGIILDRNEGLELSCDKIKAHMFDFFFNRSIERNFDKTQASEFENFINLKELKHISREDMALFT